MNDAQRVVDTAAASAAASGTPATLATTRGGGWWEVKIRGRKLAAMWAMSAIGGAMLISLTTWIGISSHGTGGKGADNPLFVFLRLSIPVVIMAMYAWYGYRYADSAGEFVALRRARVGQLADSLYFLGFLWTLWALIDSFVIHEMSIAEAVFRAFGYALVTTATGMFLRLLLLQFGYSEEDQVRAGERAVEEEIGRFTQEVNRAVKSISAFHTRTDGALTAWIDSLNKSTGALKMAVDDVKLQTADLKDALVEMHKASTEHVDKLIETTLDQFTQKVGPSLEALNEANRQFITGVNASTAKVASAVGAGVKDIQTIVQAGATQTKSELLSGADAISTTIEKSEKTIEKATVRFAEVLSAEVDDVTAQTADLKDALVEMHKTSTEHVDKLIKTALDQFTQKAEPSLEALNEANRQFVTAVNASTARVESGVGAGVRDIEAVLERGATQIQSGLLSGADAITTTIQKSIETIEKATPTFAKTLSEQIASLESDLGDASKNVEEIRLSTDNVKKMVPQQRDAIDKLGRSVLTMAQELERIGRSKRKPWWMFWA